MLSLLFFTGIPSPASCEEAGNKNNALQSGDSATLKWEAPTKNVDGTPLTDLAGYKIYHDSASRGYNGKKPKQTLPLDDKNLYCRIIDKDKEGKRGRTECTYAIRDLGRGTHYFAVTAYTRAGAESDYSNEVKK